MTTKVTPEMFDPRRDASDALSGVAPWPALVDVALLPLPLRENQTVQAYLAMTDDDLVSLAASAAADAEDDEAVAAALVASVR